MTGPGVLNFQESVHCVVGFLVYQAGLGTSSIAWGLGERCQMEGESGEEGQAGGLVINVDLPSAVGEEVDEVPVINLVLICSDRFDQAFE